MAPYPLIVFLVHCEAGSGAVVLDHGDLKWSVSKKLGFDLLNIVLEDV